LSTYHQDPLLHWYLQELTTLRKMGAVFAAQYPKIAARLELTKDECADPHIERLIEAFAFLTGRIQYNIESEFPKFTTALLDNLYPHYLQPVPALTIAQFEIDTQQGQVTSGQEIPKEALLSTKELVSDKDNSVSAKCWFRTGYPLTLWPLEVSFAGFESRDKYSFLDKNAQVARVLRLQLTCQGEVTFQDLQQLQRLRFYLDESWLEVGSLYELLFLKVHQVLIKSPHRELALELPASAIEPVGFSETEHLLPHPPHAHPAYSLLQEYFGFSDKFLFVDLTQLENWFAKNPTGELVYLTPKQTEMEVLFLLTANPDKRLNIDKNSFKLGCTPIINLFPKVSEPIRVHQRHSEYRLIPDQHREASTEIHSIIKISASSDIDNTVTAVQPFFSFRHQLGNKPPQTFWFARRVPTERVGLSGTDLLLSFLNLEFTPATPVHETLFAHTLCTNRGLAGQVQKDTELQWEQGPHLKRIVCLKPATRQLSPPLGGETVWRIISHLSLNHLSFSDNTTNLIALQEMLRLYNPTQSEVIDKQINGIRKMTTTPVVGRIGNEAWRGFVRGFDITLEFDKQSYEGSSFLLLAGVLEHFLALYVSANSFTRLIIKVADSQEEWKRWSPRPGNHLQL